jgi:hypothetical protein
LISNPKQNEIDLVEYNPKSPDEDGYNAENELKNLEDNQFRYKVASANFLNKLKKHAIDSNKKPLPKVNNIMLCELFLCCLKYCPSR